jgi:hypothetical protein
VNKRSIIFISNCTSLLLVTLESFSLGGRTFQSLSFDKFTNKPLFQLFLSSISF